MKNLFTAIIELIIRITNFILQKKEKSAKDVEKEEKQKADAERLAEDMQLANAIKTGDWETVAKIREKRKHYSNL